jgi:anthranilate 3-monooxygenase (FAD) / 4-hydroxyphenylacetate 3-monooxygenase
MPARTGAQYLESLRRLKLEVYLDGRRVPDVTAEPAFRGPLAEMARLYDLQHDPRYREFMLYPSPTTGEPVSRSFQIPYSKDDLVKRRQAFKLRTDHNFGFMGRSMDFMNAYVTSWYLVRDNFARRGARFGDNAARYYEHVREHDLFLTHVLGTPQTDRSKTSAEQEERFLHLGRVRETSEGIVVRGAKMLGTMAPLAEEVLSIQFGGVAPGDDAYAVAFAIPTDTPGLSFYCREPLVPGDGGRFDHPLGSRFEEMDCIAVFDDVLIPWHRVMVDGGPGSGEVVNMAVGNLANATHLQTSARMLSQMELFCGVAMKLADTTGITGFLHVQEKLGEMLSNLEVARGVFYGTEAMAKPTPEGIWIVDSPAVRAFHLQTMRIYRRFVEIVQLLGAGGFFQAPTRADLDNPEERPALDKYLRGRPGISAEERIGLFKLAWDMTGSSFAQRMVQYATFYSGDPIRLTAGFYLGYDKQPLLDVVDRALGTRDEDDLPVVAADGGPQQRRPIPPGTLTGAYPAASHPRPGGDYSSRP